MTAYTKTKPTVSYRKSESDKWKKIFLDYEGSINYSFFYSSKATLKIYNSLNFLKAGYEIKIDIGGLHFFTGIVKSLSCSNPSQVTSAISLSLIQKLEVDLEPFLKNSTFKKGEPLKNIIPTSFDYKIKNDYVFQPYNKEKQEAFECISERSKEIVRKEELGPTNLTAKGEFCFNTKEELPKVSSKLHILNQKIQPSGIISLDIIPNKSVIAGLNFNVKIMNNAYYQKNEIISYEVRSSTLSFSSHKGSSQNIKGINSEYEKEGGDIKGISKDNNQGENQKAGE